MRVTVLCLALLLPAPAFADGASEGEGSLGDGLGLVQEGTRMLLRGLMAEIEPGLRELQERIGDLSAYHPPEVLPNGDILIRRRTPQQADPPDPPGDEVEL